MTQFEMPLPAVAKVRLEIVDWRVGPGVVVVSASSA